MALGGQGDAQDDARGLLARQGATMNASGRFRRCCSSVVEHSLGKGEVESSIPSSSTSVFWDFDGRFPGPVAPFMGRAMERAGSDGSGTPMLAVPVEASFNNLVRRGGFSSLWTAHVVQLRINH